MRIVEIEKRLRSLEAAKVPTDMTRFLIWSLQPDDADYVDGPLLVEDAAHCRSHEVANQAELAALIDRLSADGSQWPPVKRQTTYSKEMYGRKR
jgi:hypothetical protein